MTDGSGEERSSPGAADAPPFPPPPRREPSLLRRSPVFAGLDGFVVLRDGERPRTRWLPVAGSAILALLAAVNLRALVRNLTSSTRT